MTETLPLTARVAASVVIRLKALAAAQDRSVSYLVGEALARYLDDEEWQVAQIQAAIAEANASDAQFVDHADMDLWFEQILLHPDAPAPAPGPGKRPRGDRPSVG